MSIVINGKSLDVVQMKNDWQHGLDDKTLLELRALPLEQQIERFSIGETTCFAEYSYGKEDSNRSWQHIVSIDKCPEVLGVVVDNGTVVGVYVKAWYHYNRPLFVGQCCCVYSVCDEDGTGRDERDDYIVLHLN
ncbi:MAG: hypothetical protein IKC47_02305 [Clostridia bacterium]|nr:hypothetical protein [Clostridia bacterium]